MAKKVNGRELLRADNDSLRKQFMACRRLLDAERVENQEYREKIDVAIYEIGLLHKKISPSENSNTDNHFKTIIEILNG